MKIPNTEINMAFSQLLLYSGFIFINILAFESDLAVNDQITNLPDYIIPTHYNIVLSQNLNNTEIISYFDGICHIDITIHSITQDIGFYAQEPSLRIIDAHKSVLANTPLPDGFNISHTVFNYTYDDKSHIFNLRFLDMIYPGEYTLSLTFITYVHNITHLRDDIEGLFSTTYINEDGNRTWLIASNSYARKARQIFPCWDELTFVATYKISILHNKKYTALSNMEVSSILNRENDMILTKFYETPLMPAYHIAIMISDLSRANKEFLTLRSYVTYDIIYNLGSRQMAEGIKFAEMILKHVILLLEYQYKYCERVAKVHYIVLPIFYPNIIQNRPGLIFYRGASIIYDEMLDSFAHKIEVADLIRRETVLQCFKRRGGSAWWPHSWLYEGIARLSADDAISKTFRDGQEVLNLLAVQEQQESLLLNFIMKPLSELNATYSHSTISHYIKAPNILRMLRHMLTAEVFFNGIDTFLNSLPLFRINEGDNIYVEDLWTKMELVLNKSDNRFKFDVRRTMHFWTRLDDYPIVRIIQYNSSHAKIFVENINAIGAVFLPITTQKYFSKSMEWYFSDMQLIPFDRSINEFFFLQNDHYCDFIIVNIQQNGYYRVIYDGMCWKCIVQYLVQKSWNDTKFINEIISPSNYARIIDDAFYFVMNYKLHLFAFLDLLQYVLRDINYIVWYPVIKGLEHISSFFLFEESSMVKTYMRDKLRLLLNDIGYVEISDEPDSIKCLRQEAAKWACFFGDIHCKTNALFLLKQHLPNNTKILPWWKMWTYCNGLMQDVNIWSDMFRAWMFHSHSYLIKYLPCSEFPIVAFDDLKEIIYNLEGRQDFLYSVTTDAKDRVNFFLSIVARHARNRTVFEYILEKFHYIKPREVSPHIVIIVMMNHMYSSKQLHKVLHFVKAKEDEAKRINPTYVFAFDTHKAQLPEGTNRQRFTDISSFIEQKLHIRLSDIEKQRNYFLPLTMSFY